MSNFTIDGKLPNSETQDEQLLLAQKLLHFYNSRLGLSISLDYNTIDFQFKTKNNDELSFKCACFVDYYMDWAIQSDKDSNKWIGPFMSRRENMVDNIKSIYLLPKSFDRDSQVAKDYFDFKRDEFTKLYRNFDCLTFLNDNNQKLTKDFLNNLCDGLDVI